MWNSTKVVKMDGRPKRFVRIQSDRDENDNYNFDTDEPINWSDQQFSANLRGSGVRQESEKRILDTPRRSNPTNLKGFPAYDESDSKPGAKTYLDPTSAYLQRWNSFFIASCLIAVSVDPLFYYLPYFDSRYNCIGISEGLKKFVTVFRSITDFLYMIHMFLQFKTAFIAPSSRVFGRGDLVTDPKKIAARYLRKTFWVDLVAVLPIPQLVIWVLIPVMNSSAPALRTKKALRFIVLAQYLPRLFRLYPLTSKIINTTGVLMETAWAGTAFNLVIYLLVSHVVGAGWYMMAIERQQKCWAGVCANEAFCQPEFLDCASLAIPGRMVWLASTVGAKDCSVDNFNYGIFNVGMANNITSTNFITKYFYSLWLGLLGLSSLAQTLQVSTYGWEIIFDIVMIMLGLLMFAFLVGNMETYLQSLTLRLEQMRVNRRDSEQWMHHRNLPHDLVERVRRYEQYKWTATRGVNEELLVRSLPSDLRRDIKRHLCLDLIRNVPFFDKMDESLLDAICERLQTSLCTEGTNILREGDPVNEMLFIIRGTLESKTVSNGRSDNYAVLKAGSFCGEELLTWALDPKPQNHFPVSTRTVRAVMEVEAFSLSAGDLKFVANQFRRLHSVTLQQTFRYYSHHWRTWAASFIQAAWRRCQRRRLAELRRSEEEMFLLEEALVEEPEENHQEPSSRPIALAGRLVENPIRGVQLLASMQAAELSRISNIPKPAEPDFSSDS